MEISRSRYKTDPDFRRRVNDTYNRWVGNNREYFNMYMRNYSRTHYIRYHGRCIKVKKRSQPDECEWCGKAVLPHKWLVWHHWDDKHPEYGLWLCWKCHVIAEFLEQTDSMQKIEEYMLLKCKMSNMPAPLLPFLKFHAKNSLEQSSITL